MTIREIYSFLDGMAPFRNQDKTDNSGLLVGDHDDGVGRVLVCLDATNKVVSEAARKNVDLIIAHHPLMYRPISELSRKDPVYALVNGDINMIAMHTNLDAALGGISDLMLERLGLPKGEEIIDVFNPDGTGYGRITGLDRPVTARELAEKCKEAFKCSVVRYVDSGKAISRLAVSSGNSGDLVEAVVDAGCDAFICGDIKLDKMIYAANYGLTLIDAGHFHTEDIVCEDLVCRLKSRFPDLEVEKSANSVDICEYVT